MLGVGLHLLGVGVGLHLHNSGGKLVHAQACFVTTYVCAAFAHGIEHNSSRMQL